MNQSKATNQATSLSDIPPGFTMGTAPDGNQYLVPTHMVSALDQAFASYQCKINMGVPAAVGGVSLHLIACSARLAGNSPVTKQC